MQQLIGNFPLLRRLYPNRGWYRWQYMTYSDTPHQLGEPWGPYPTREEAMMRGDPIPPQLLSYRLTMPVGCHDIRKPVELKW